MKHHPNTTGFTLIEIMVVISLISILTLVAFTSVSGPTREAALDGSYASVITAFEAARNRAMQGVGDGASTHAVEVAGDGRSIILSDGVNSAEIPLSHTVTLDQAGQTITFDRISGETNLGSDMTFTLTDTTTGLTRTATVTPAGYIYHE